MSIDVSLLPRRELAAGARLYRLHRREHGPWYFGGDGSGRFDPVGVGARGACYWAEHPLGAWVEVFRTVMTIDEEDVVRHAVSILTLANPIEVVDLADRRGLAAGATAAVGAGASHIEAQALAIRVHNRVDGIRWRVSHDPAQELIGIALFGPQGARSASSFGSTSTAPVGRALVRAAEDAFGYRVVSTP